MIQEEERTGHVLLMDRLMKQAHSVLVHIIHAGSSREQLNGDIMEALHKELRTLDIQALRGSCKN